MSVSVVTGIAFEGSSIVILARITGEDGQAITVDDIEDIAFQVWDVGKDPGAPSYQQSTADFVTERGLAPDAVLYDSLQLDNRWTVDDEGYNFAATIDATELPEVEAVFFETVTVGAVLRSKTTQNYTNVLITVQFTPAVVGTGTTVAEQPKFKGQWLVKVLADLFGKNTGTGT